MLRTLKADLQIHSPRDPQYAGWDWGTDGNLEHWCDVLIDACLANGMGLISVTDHHDLTASTILVRRVRERALEEKIWVLPGMEITSSHGLQLMLYFNPNAIPTNDVVLGAIGVPHTSVPPLEIAVKLPVVQPSSQTAGQIFESLQGQFGESHPFFLVPVVLSRRSSDGLTGNDLGREVILKPWVIAAVFAGTGEWNRNILSGRDRQWSNKPITVVRSSDHRGYAERSRDRSLPFFANWGQEPLLTYIKLSEPSVESFKQALVSGENKRVFYTLPESPSTFLRQLTIVHSPLLRRAEFADGKIEVNFSPNLNCIIGGRGTGKSILLSALARVLGMDAKWNQEMLSEWQQRHLSLFESNAPFDPSRTKITLEYERSNVSYRVEYNREEGVDGWRLYRQQNDTWLLLGRFSEKPLDIPDSLFYLQGQLGALTDHASDQAEVERLVMARISEDRQRLRDRMEQKRERYRTLVQQRVRYSELQVTRETLNIKIGNLNAEIEGLQRIAGIELSPNENKLLFAESQFQDTLSILSSRESEIQVAKNSIGNLLESLKRSIENEVSALRALSTAGWETPSLTSYSDQLDAWSKRVVEAGQALTSLLTTFPDEFRESHLHTVTAIQELLLSARKTIGTSESATLARNQVSTKISELGELKEQEREVLSELDALQQYLNEDPTQLQHEIVKLAQEYTEKLQACAAEINADSSLSLEVQVRPAGRYQNFIYQRLKPLASDNSCRIEEKFWFKLTEYLDAQENPGEIWVKLLNEVEGPSAENAESWKAAGFTWTGIENLRTKIPSDDWKLIMGEWIEDEVTLSFIAPNGQKIPLSKASPGQKAVQLLRLVLRDFEGPVIIDQPEGDLDNRYLVDDFVNELHVEKKKHQLIFVTHNANIAVHGDAELIHVMDLIVQTTSNPEIAEALNEELCTLCATGTIDQISIRENIERILEGGHDAFFKRAEKYQ